MMLLSDNFFALPQIQTLLREELFTIERYSAQVAAGNALFLTAYPDTLRVETQINGLKSLHLHILQTGLLAGDFRCSPHAFPCSSESLQLIATQHVAETLENPFTFEAELMRMLAPGALLLVTGFNPSNPWMLWQSHYGNTTPLLHLSGAFAMRRRLHQLGLQCNTLRFIGPIWPKSDCVASKSRANSFISALRCAYVLIARKRREMPIGRRLEAKPRTIVLSPRLTPTHRVS